MVRVWLWLVLLAGCGLGDGGGDAGGGDAGGGDAGEGIDAAPADPWFDDEPRRGVIQVLEMQTPFGAAGIAQAAYLEAPTRMRFVHYAQIVAVHWQMETMREGACRLLENRSAFCTRCAGICVDSEVCEPLPVYVSAGTLVFDGLTVPLELAPSPYWYTSQASVPADAYADGSRIETSAAGAAVAFHTVAADAPLPLVAEVGPGPLNLVDGADHEIRWTPAAGGARIRLLLNADNQGHGNPFEAIIECEGPDTGVLTVPRALIEAFPPVAGGLGGCEGSDCPLSQLTRYRRAAADVAGDRVVLAIGSEIQFPLVHD